MTDGNWKYLTVGLITGTLFSLVIFGLGFYYKVTQV